MSWHAPRMPTRYRTPHRLVCCRCPCRRCPGCTAKTAPAWAGRGLAEQQLGWLQAGQFEAARIAGPHAQRRAATARAVRVKRNSLHLAQCSARPDGKCDGAAANGQQQHAEHAPQPPQQPRDAQQQAAWAAGAPAHEVAADAPAGGALQQVGNQQAAQQGAAQQAASAQQQQQQHRRWASGGVPDLELMERVSAYPASKSWGRADTAPKASAAGSPASCACTARPCVVSRANAAAARRPACQTALWPSAPPGGWRPRLPPPALDAAVVLPRLAPGCRGTACRARLHGCCRRWRSACDERRGSACSTLTSSCPCTATDAAWRTSTVEASMAPAAEQQGQARQMAAPHRRLRRHVAPPPQQRLRWRMRRHQELLLLHILHRRRSLLCLTLPQRQQPLLRLLRRLLQGRALAAASRTAGVRQQVAMCTRNTRNRGSRGRDCSRPRDGSNKSCCTT